MTPPVLPKSVDIAVIGAGPQALTLTTHLLQKKKSFRPFDVTRGKGRVAVFDPSGTWMQQWRQQFAAFEIPHLRSPAVHHPDPDPYALRRFALNRDSELFPPYDLPGTQLFEDFCQDVVQRWQLENAVIPAQIVAIEPRSPRERYGFRLHTAAGKSVLARRVVVAVGGGTPQIPDWAQCLRDGGGREYPGDRLQHSGEIDLRQFGRSQLRGEQILIVGSGLTSGHLAIGAAKRGATVTMVAQRQFYDKLFDADPGWLGPKYLKGFHAEPSWEQRAQMVRSARNGGSLTPAVMLKLRRLERSGQLTFVENCQIARAAWQGSAWRVDCHSETERFTATSCDRLWLATGSQVDIRQHPLFEPLWETAAIPVVSGLPVLDDRLRWGRYPLFLMGAWAALQVGPTARNLYGGKLASQRIVPALVKPSLALPVVA